MLLCWNQRLVELQRGPKLSPQQPPAPRNLVLNLCSLRWEHWESAHTRQLPYKPCQSSPSRNGGKIQCNQGGQRSGALEVKPVTFHEDGQCDIISCQCIKMRFKIQNMGAAILCHLQQFWCCLSNCGGNGCRWPTGLLCGDKGLSEMTFKS